MNPALFSYPAYKKILENDLNALTEECMESKEYDAMVNYYLDQKYVPDDHLIPLLKADLKSALAEGDIIRGFQLNAFLGYIKKTKAEYEKRNKRKKS